MKKLFTLLVCIVLASVIGVQAASTNTPSLFQGKEVSVGLSTSYRLSSSLTDLAPYSQNVAAEVGYFQNKYLGVQGTLPFYNTKGVAVQNVEGVAVVRLPFTVAEHFGFAPYVGGGVDYNWQNNNALPLAKGGVEWRFRQGWGLFTEYKYELPSWTKTDNGMQSVSAGIRLNF